MRLFLVLLAFPLLAQNPVYNDVSPTVKGITIGQNKCYWWLGSKAIQTVCWSGSLVVQNSVGTFNQGQGTVTGSLDLSTYTLDGIKIPGSVIKWIFSLGKFNVSVVLPNGATPINKNGTYAN